jgi:hypothetical protein
MVQARNKLPLDRDFNLARLKVTLLQIVISWQTRSLLLGLSALFL